MAIRGLLLALMVLATAAKALSADANDLVRVLQSGRCASCCLADADLSDADLQGAELQRANLGQACLDLANQKGRPQFQQLERGFLAGGRPARQQALRHRPTEQ